MQIISFAIFLLIGNAANTFNCEEVYGVEPARMSRALQKLKRK